ncbi:hypothetical protein OHS81_26700 [Streptomyces sp. NBC_00400]|uniref:hypothetical protein n=1 Tax=Streptomyces sp. NBC_00400 TaxID=2975737 RepID=UPI002E1B317E
MVETVVQILTQMTGGTAAAVGTGVGQAISDVVRGRLTRSDDGRSAMRAVDERPGDPVAVEELRALLRAEMDADPDFAGQIATVLAGAPPAESPRSVSGGITIDGSTLRGRNTISLGPVTFHNTRNARFSLLAAALVFVALVALGIYGGARLVTGGGGAQERSVTALSAGALRQVLPELSSLPPGWTQPEGPKSGKSHLRKGFGLTHLDSADYLMGDPDAKLHCSVAAFTSADKASALYRKNQVDERETGTTRVPLPQIGDESYASSYPPGNGNEGGIVLNMRVGSVLVIISGGGSDGQPFETSRLEVLGKMLAERAQQAQNGQKPAATARNA